ncbi:MAG: hypothetical protein JWP57_357 [Spirosoma sp.]|nr:hypothetical protein [Spirosoma sp.]
MISLDTTSLIKVIIVLGLAIAVWLLLAYRERVGPLLQRHERTTIYLTFVVLRLVPFVCVYLVLNQEPRNDVEFFYRKATAALQGKLVYRDFMSYHGPLFSYLISWPLLLWRNGKVIVLLMALVELVIAIATLRRYRDASNTPVVWFVLYYLLPLPFVALVLCGQEDEWMWGFCLLTLAVPPGRRFSFWCGVVWGIGMLTIKFMLIVFLIPLFFIVPNRWQYVAGLLVVGLPSMLVLYALVGMDFLMPIQHSSLPMTPNLVSVLRPMLGTYLEQIPLTYLNWAGLLATIGGASLVGHRYRLIGYRPLLPLLYVFTFGLFMICLPSSPGFYLYAHALPLVFVVLSSGRGRQAWPAFIVLNVLAVVQTILSIVYNKQDLYNGWSQINGLSEWADYGMQCVQVMIFVYLLWIVLDQMRTVAGQEQLTEMPSSVPTS